MKKIIILLMFATISSLAIAQNCPGRVITPSSNSDCILTLYPRPPSGKPEEDGKEPPGPESLLDSTECNRVCKGSRVTYSIQLNAGETATWAVVGDNNHYAISNNAIEVNWDYFDEASVSVTIRASNGIILYEETLCVVLIDLPQVNSTTMPSAASGTNNITICLGESIEFRDSSMANSSNPQRPIVGNIWQALVYPTGGVLETATTNNYTFTPTLPGTYTVNHTAINSCGCRKLERYLITVNQGPVLEISCYGTVCHNTTHTYSVVNNNLCSSYNWTAQNGQILSTSNNGQTVTVQWGNPPDGYGILSLTGNCTGVCSNNLGVRIPIIPSVAIISGPDTVCLGETQMYSMPLWGSTYYNWSVTDSLSSLFYFGDTPNSILFPLNHVGNAYIDVDYSNYFLNKDPFFILFSFCSGHVQ
jgi:hypothetical protein